MRRTAFALAGALLLAGCPIPQAVPDYPPGNRTPPRILIDQIANDGAVVQFVPANCMTTEPSYPLNASVLDTNTIESVVARWFVNYDARYLLNYLPLQDDAVSPNSDPNVLTRPLPQFVFQPYQHPPAPGAPSASGPPYPQAGITRVVELVVSNGFDPSAVTTSSALPYRTPLATFETQVYRWVFLSVDPPPGCGLGTAGCCP